MQKTSDLKRISVRFLGGKNNNRIQSNSQSLVDCTVEQTLHLKGYGILSIMG